MSQTDYTAIAIITIFNSLCYSIGKELGEELVKWIKGKLGLLRSQSLKETLEQKHITL